MGRCNPFGVCRSKNRKIIVIDHSDCRLEETSPTDTSQTKDENSNSIFEFILYLYNQGKYYHFVYDYASEDCIAMYRFSEAI